MASSKSTCFLLQKIPGELRNDIYGHVYEDDKPDSTAAVNLLDPHPPGGKSLLLTCRQINKEARGCQKEAYRKFWKESRFKVDITKDLDFHGPLAGLKAQDLDNVTSLTLYQHTYSALLCHNYSLVDRRGLWRLITASETVSIFCYGIDISETVPRTLSFDRYGSVLNLDETAARAALEQRKVGAEPLHFQIVALIVAMAHHIKFSHGIEVESLPKLLGSRY